MKTDCYLDERLRRLEISFGGHFEGCGGVLLEGSTECHDGARLRAQWPVQH